MNSEELTLELTIDKLVYGGYGIARHEGRTVFVPNVAPGEKIKAILKKKRKGVQWAELQEVLETNSSYRAKPHCRHTIECGGCSYQHLKTEAQQKIKEEILREIYGYKHELQPSLVSPEHFQYRNKCEFTFGDNLESGMVELGLHPEGKFFEVLDLQECQLLPSETWSLLQSAKKLVQESGFLAYKDLKDQGFWSTITVRRSSSSGELLLIWKVKDPTEPKLQHINRQLMAEFSNLKGVLAQPTPRGQLQLLAGRDTLSQKVGPIQLVYGAANFFQINMTILPLFMERITALVKNIEPDIVYDLFGGVGAIGIYVAKALPELKQVIGAETDQLACQMADFNAELNDLKNYQSNFLNLYKGGWGKFLKVHNKNVCVIVDPPRAGLSGKTVKEILELAPKNIIYVSCNPSTQKRDIDLLEEAGYKLETLQLVDMFPQTLHLESIAKLTKG